jgi:hypothetical protein
MAASPWRHWVAAVLALGAGSAAMAEPAPSPGSIWTGQGENDSVSTTPGGSDRYYTSGLRIGWTSGTDAVPAFARGLATRVWGDGQTRVSIDVMQQIYTPRNIFRVSPNPRDHPVAAILAADFGLIQDTDRSRSTLVVTAGVIGPAALGRQVQNGFHELIHDRINKGWADQLPNEPALNLTAGRTWRLGLVQALGVETDMLPSLTAGVGTVRDYAQAGVIFRVGQGLDSDFGVSRIWPGVSGGDAYAPTRDFVWYVFAGVNGQVVGRDAFLDGNIFSSSRHVEHLPLVGEMEAGGAVIWHGVRISYTQTWQTNRFRGQKGGLFNFGSLTGSVRF